MLGPIIEDEEMIYEKPGSARSDLTRRASQSSEPQKSMWGFVRFMFSGEFEALEPSVVVSVEPIASAIVFSKPVTTGPEQPRAPTITNQESAPIETPASGGALAAFGSFFSRSSSSVADTQSQAPVVPELNPVSEKPEITVDTTPSAEEVPGFMQFITDIAEEVSESVLSASSSPTSRTAHDAVPESDSNPTPLPQVVSSLPQHKVPGIPEPGVRTQAPKPNPKAIMQYVKEFTGGVAQSVMSPTVARVPVVDPGMTEEVSDSVKFAAPAVPSPHTSYALMRPKLQDDEQRTPLQEEESDSERITDSRSDVRVESADSSADTAHDSKHCVVCGRRALAVRRRCSL